MSLEEAGPLVGGALWVCRLVNHLALAAVIGFLLVAVWLTPSAGSPRLGRAARRATGTAALAAAVWVVAGAGLFVFGLANAAAVPAAEVLDPGALGRFAGTRFGAVVAVQAAVAGGVAVVAAAATTRTGAGVALALASLAALGPAAWGHAATADPPVVAVANDWVHVLAASGWVGGLAGVTVLAFAGAARSAAADLVRTVRRFSGFAAWALAAVLTTGVVNVALRTTDVALLLQTAWGRLALTKVGLVAAIGALAWWNRTRLLPRLPAASGRSAFRRVAVAELGLMAVTFAVAATMASGVPPDVEDAARVETVDVAFGDGSANLVVDPAATGANELHLFFFGADGGLRPVDDAAVVLRRGGQAVDASLVGAGPGHYVAPGVTLAEPGPWEVRVSGLVDGRQASATATITIR